MEPDSFVKGKWFDERTMIIRVPPADGSKCRWKGLDGVGAGRMYDYVVICKGLRSKNCKADKEKHATYVSNVIFVSEP